MKNASPETRRLVARETCELMRKSEVLRKQLKNASLAEFENMNRELYNIEHKIKAKKDQLERMNSTDSGGMESYYIPQLSNQY